MTNSTQYRYRLDAEIVTRAEGQPVQRSWGVLDPDGEYVSFDDLTVRSAGEARSKNTQTADDFEEVRELLDRYGPISRVLLWDRDDAFVHFGRSTETANGEVRVATMEVRGPDLDQHFARLAKGDDSPPPRPTSLRDRCDACRGTFEPREKVFNWYLFDGSHRWLCDPCGYDVVADPESSGLIDDGQWVRAEDPPAERRIGVEGGLR